MNTITFPAILISEGNSFFLVDEVIERCVYQGWENGFFDDMWYFDGQGRLWPIASAKLKEEPGFPHVHEKETFMLAGRSNMAWTDPVGTHQQVIHHK
jgi:hypothetical protein